MTKEEINQIFSETISVRNWYAGTSINRTQASELKRKFARNKVTFGKILEVLIELDKIKIVSNVL